MAATFRCNAEASISIHGSNDESRSAADDKAVAVDNPDSGATLAATFRKARRDFTIIRDPLMIPPEWAPAVRRDYLGSGTVGNTYTFLSDVKYSPNSALIPSNSFFTAARYSRSVAKSKSSAVMASASI